MVQKNRILNACIGLGVVICLVLVGVLVWASITPKSAVSQPLLYNAFFADDIENDTFRYYNGNSLYKYDIRSATSTPLVTNKYFLLENISSMHWLENAIVFTISEPTPWSSFNQFDIIEGPESVVWYMSLSDGAMKPLSINIWPSDLSKSVLETPEGLIVSAADGAVIIDNSGKVSPLLGDNKMNSEVILHIVDYSNNSLLYVTPENSNFALYRYDTAKKQKELVLKDLIKNPESAEDFAAYKSGNSVIFTDYTDSSDETTRSVVAYDMSKKKRSTLLLNFAGIVEQATVTKTVEKTISIYESSEGSVKKLHTFDDISSQPVHTDCEKDICYMFQRGGIVRAVASKATDIAFIKPGFHDPLEKIIKSDTTYVTRNILSDSDNEYDVAIANGKLQERYKELVDAVVATQRNPAEFTFVITAGRSVEY